MDRVARSGPSLPVPSVTRSHCRFFVQPQSPSTRKEGSAIDSPLQRGQCPGPRSRSRFRNTNPQSLQAAGICTRRRPAARRLLRRCSRCSPISFSRLPTADDSSFAVRGPSARQARIRRRTVSRSSDGIAAPDRPGLRFSGCLRVERLQELDDFAAPALRAFPFPFLVLLEGEDLPERLAALRAFEGIRGHALLLIPGEDGILTPKIFQRWKYSTLYAGKPPPRRPRAPHRPPRRFTLTVRPRIGKMSRSRAGTGRPAAAGCEARSAETPRARRGHR